MLLDFVPSVPRRRAARARWRARAALRFGTTTSAAWPAVRVPVSSVCGRHLTLNTSGKRLEHQPLEIPGGHRAIPMTQALAAAAEVLGDVFVARPPNDSVGCSTRRMLALRWTRRVMVPAGNPDEQVLLEVLERQGPG